jgi:hypothetical protein
MFLSWLVKIPWGIEFHCSLPLTKLSSLMKVPACQLVFPSLIHSYFLSCTYIYLACFILSNIDSKGYSLLVDLLCALWLPCMLFSCSWSILAFWIPLLVVPASRCGGLPFSLHLLRLRSIPGSHHFLPLGVSIVDLARSHLHAFYFSSLCDIAIWFSPCAERWYMTSIVWLWLCLHLYSLIL